MGGNNSGPGVAGSTPRKAFYIQNVVCAGLQREITVRPRQGMIHNVVGRYLSLNAA